MLLLHIRMLYKYKFKTTNSNIKSITVIETYRNFILRVNLFLNQRIKYMYIDKNSYLVRTIGTCRQLKKNGE